MVSPAHAGRCRRVVVTGVGVIHALGTTVPQFWEALTHGKSGVTRISAFDASQYDSQIASEVKAYDPSKYLTPKDQKHMERFVQFAIYAAKEALLDARLDLAKEDPFRVGAILGSGIGSLHMLEEQHSILMERGPSRMSPFMIPKFIVNMAVGQVAILLGIKGPNACVATACASGNHAIGEAFRVIERGDADVMFCGGTEGAISPLGIGGFCAMKALSTARNHEPEKASRPFDKLRDGFVMGEGAGIVVVESLEHALKRNASIYAELVGYGFTADAYHMTAPDPEGLGAAKAMALAIQDAGLKPQDISYINAHGTSTPLNDKVETLAIKQVFGEYAKKIPVSSTKSMTGHLLGAAGGIECVISALTITHHLIPPTINYEVPDPDCDLDYVPNKARAAKVNVVLSNSLGFGGHNATVVLKRYEG